MDSYEHLSKLLQTKPEILRRVDSAMKEKFGDKGVIEKMLEKNDSHIVKMLEKLGDKEATQGNVREIMRGVIADHERQVLDYLKKLDGENRFEKAVKLVRRIARVDKGFFLKRDRAEDILRKRPPENLLRYLKLDNVEEIFKKYDITEAFSALRFVESNEWMHKTFDEAYSNFTADDFEERDIEIRALGPEWHEIAKKFLEKKRHNVSHLKEFGVIFLNPIREEAPGKFFRDFALLFHYIHEVDFYAKMFKRYNKSADFAERLKSLLRGDILDTTETKGSEWLLVQRYLDKEDPNDPRLLLPRVNPEATHWTRGERDLVLLGKEEESIDLELWEDLDWVGCLCTANKDEVVSFDLEDNAMSLVAHNDGKEIFYNYHQREAMWTKLFTEYVGGEKEMERLVIENFDKGIVSF
jgi:hypothetical protein